MLVLFQEKKGFLFLFCCSSREEKSRADKVFEEKKTTFWFCLFVSRKEGFVSRTRRAACFKNRSSFLLLVSRTALLLLLRSSSACFKNRSSSACFKNRSKKTTALFQRRNTKQEDNYLFQEKEETQSDK